MIRVRFRGNFLFLRVGAKYIVARADDDTDMNFTMQDYILVSKNEIILPGFGKIIIREKEGIIIYRYGLSDNEEMIFKIIKVMEFRALHGVELLLNNLLKLARDDWAILVLRRRKCFAYTYVTKEGNRFYV